MSLNLILKGLEYEDPEFHKALKKWAPFLNATVKKLCRMLNQNYDDLLQDMMVALVSANALYPVPLYRFGYHVYEMVCERGSLVCLKTNRICTSKFEWFWTSKSNIEEVKKGKLDFLIGMKIRQQCYVLIRNNTFQKHGYRKKSISTEGLTNKWGKPLHEAFELKKEVQKCSLADDKTTKLLQSSFVEDFRVNNPEAAVLCGQYVQELGRKVSGPSEKIMKLLLWDPGLQNVEISKLLGISRVEVSLRKKELQKGLRKILRK